MVSASPKAPKIKYQLRMIPLDHLSPTEDNTRRPITQTSVESLARSMVKDGVLQPIVVRPHPAREGHWEIRAGERRWRAAKLAGLKEIPALVKPLDDESARTVTIAENLLRENLHPLEEAAGIQRALDQGQDPKKLAARLGKSVAFILRRASLTRLSETWRFEVLRRESEVGRLSVAHLELIARLPAETQDLLATNGFNRVFARGYPAVADLRRLIEDGLRTLVSMPWKLDDDTLEPKAGSCLNCPKRSGMQPALFDNEDAPKDSKVSKTDRCLDPACFDRKHAAFIVNREAELRRDHPGLRLVQIGYDGVGPATAQAIGERATRVYSPHFVKPNDKTGTPAMQISGPKAGQLVRIDFGDMHPDGRVTKSGRSTDASGKPTPLSLDERKARLYKRRDAFVVAKVLELLRVLTPKDLVKTVAEIGKRTDAAAKGFDPLALVLAFGTNTRADRDHDDDAWARYEKLRLREGALPVPTALHEVVQVWASRLGGSDTHHVTEQANDARRICGLLGIDGAAIEEQAAQEIPTPKSWAALDDNSTRSLGEGKPKPPAEGSLKPEEPPFDPSPPKSSPGPTKRGGKGGASKPKTRAHRKPHARRRNAA
jgi:ParB/RepB/Spo0J family partition protein